MACSYLYLSRYLLCCFFLTFDHIPPQGLSRLRSPQSSAVRSRSATKTDCFFFSFFLPGVNAGRTVISVRCCCCCCCCVADVSAVAVVSFLLDRQHAVVGRNANIAINQRTVEVAVTAKIETSSHVGRVLGQTKDFYCCTGTMIRRLQRSSNQSYLCCWPLLLFFHVLHCGRQQSAALLGLRGSRHNDGWGLFFWRRCGCCFRVVFVATLLVLLLRSVRCCSFCCSVMITQRWAEHTKCNTPNETRKAVTADRDAHVEDEVTLCQTYLR
jgi:hypothetical protein